MAGQRRVCPACVSLRCFPNIYLQRKIKTKPKKEEMNAVSQVLRISKRAEITYRDVCALSNKILTKAQGLSNHNT